MRVLLAALTLGLSACAEIEDASPAVKRQAMGDFTGSADGGPQVKGTSLFAHLGAVVTACPDGGYAAGAPGDDSVWLSPARLRIGPTRTSLIEVIPYPLACVGSGPSLRALVGGPSAWSLFADGGAAALASSRVDAIDSTPGVFLAVSNTATGTISTYPSTASTFATPIFSTIQGQGVGSALAWNPRADLIVANELAHTVGVYLANNTFDGGRLYIAPVGLMNPDLGVAGSDFGAVVVTGNVIPDATEETIVSAPTLGRVYIFSGTLHVMTLQGGASFGAALAVEPRDVGGGLHALWVGEPQGEQVHRFIGTDDTRFSSPLATNSARFGAAIAVDLRGLVAVGAPNYTDGLLLEAGAVFEGTPDAGTLLGLAMQCDAGLSCVLPGCTTGTCLGDVFCERTRAVGSDCTAFQACDVPTNTCFDAGLPADAGSADAGSADAGSADAGSVDAGSADAGSADAGSRDAGTMDAGENDAGELNDAGSTGKDGGATAPNLVFHTSCGCGTGGVPALLWVALLVLRGRRFGRLFTSQ